MFDTIIRPDHAAGLFGLSRAGIYKWASDGLLPPPIKIGKRASGWPASELTRMQKMRIAGASVSEIKAAVIEMIEARQREAA